MKPRARLDSAAFHLTPTRTRCDLIITANGKAEKIASGLLEPFLAHLKTAKDQDAKGGYSILLKPKNGCDGAWFTKGTVERFVRFVSTPEILERVYTIESEILQIKEAIAIQCNNDFRMNPADEFPEKSTHSLEGPKPVLEANEEKAIVLYNPGANQHEANQTTANEGESKAQLLKVLETRKTVLRKEQSMAFARAVAAGFDADHITLLISFSESFGASRLMDACLRFMELWKRKHDTGQWLEVEAADAMPIPPDCSMDVSGITTFTDATNVQKEHGEGKPESSAYCGPGNNEKGERIPMNHHVPVANQEYVQGQIPHPIFPSWPIHPPPGTLPFFQPYPMQGIPYYQNYPGNGSYIQPPYQSVEPPRNHSDQRIIRRRNSMDSRDSNSESETWDQNVARMRPPNEKNSETEESMKKAGHPGRRKHSEIPYYQNYPGNGSYFQPPYQSVEPPRNHSDQRIIQRNSMDSRDSNSESETWDQNVARMRPPNEKKTETEEFMKKAGHPGRRKHSGMVVIRNLNYIASKEQASSLDRESQTDSVSAADGDDDGESEDADAGMMKRNSLTSLRREGRNTKSVDAFNSLGKNSMIHEKEDDGGQWKAFQNYLLRDAVEDRHVTEKITGHSVNGKGFIDGRVELREMEGRGGGSYGKHAADDFIIHGQENHSVFRGSLDPLAVSEIECTGNFFDKSSLHAMADESFIVPSRPDSLGQSGTDHRAAVDMCSVFPSQADDLSKRVDEPDVLSLMPERGVEKSSSGYDPAFDYEMQGHAGDAATVVNMKKEIVNVKREPNNKFVRGQKSLIESNALDKKKLLRAKTGKPLKLSPSDEARARAERLRNFKADLQKVKKEKEDESSKRLETLKMERQKRIAARCSVPVSSPVPSQITRSQLPSKCPPNSQKGLKFSDSEPKLPSAPQKASNRSLTLSTNSLITSKSSSLDNGSRVAGRRLSQSLCLLESKKDNAPKASMGRSRRLSETKKSSNFHIPSVKLQSPSTVSNTKSSNGLEKKKNVSAIISLDKAKSAALPELKIRTSKVPPNVKSIAVVSVATKTTKQNRVAISSVTREVSDQNRKVNNILDRSSMDDDNPVIEKKVVTLECEKSPVPSVRATDIMVLPPEHCDDHQGVHAPVCVPIYCGLPEHSRSCQVPAEHAKEETTTLCDTTTIERPYQAPFARNSSIEDPCAKNSEYGKAPPNFEVSTTRTDSARALVPDFKNLKLEKIPESLEKSRVKESSKRFRRLLKFGRKDHTSAAGDQGSDATTGAASNEASRTFSLLTPFARIAKRS